MSNYDQRGQKIYGPQYNPGRDMILHPPQDSEDKKSRVGKALFSGVFSTLLGTLFADWVKIIITGRFDIVVGPHPNMDFWPVISNIAQYSYPWPFYVGLALGIVSFLSYLIFGKDSLRRN